MKDDVGNSEPRDQLAFFGAITASLSHELMNVISIVNEYGGLLEDLAAAAEGPAGAVSADRLRAFGEKLTTQARRGEELLKRLNRFAHSVDHPTAAFDARAVALDIVDLSRRLAELKRVELKTRFSDESCPMTGDPFAFQQAIHLAIRIAVSSASESGWILVGYDAAASGCHVEVECEGPLDVGENTLPDRRMLEHVAAQGNVDLEIGSSKIGLYFR